MDVTVESLDGIQSFGRMVLCAPQLQKLIRKGKLTTAELLATCRALARTKFFDGDMFEDLHSELRNLLRGDKLDVQQMDEVMLFIYTLNAYDKKLFGAIARSFKAKTATMDAEMRESWLGLYIKFKHDA